VGQSREDQFLVTLHNDPRWPFFLEKVGMSDAQMAAIFNDDNDGQ